MSKTYWFALAVAAAAPIASAADITGKITLSGDPPAEKPINLSGDVNCGPLWKDAKPTTRVYVVSPDKGLGDVVIYLKGVAPANNPNAEPVELDQVKCMYTPYVLAIQTGQKLLVKNSDPFMHNVNTSPKDPGNAANRMNKAQANEKASPFQLVYTKPEPFVSFACNVHPWMYAYVYVLDHPYFAVSDPSGNFTLANVPPGTYEIEAHHRRAGKSTQKVTVGNDPVKVDFTLEVPKQ